MPIHYRPTIAEIDLDALRHNVREVRKRVPKECSIMAIVKADAYGHGALFCARVLKGCGVESLGVATAEEGIELRNGGVRGDIFVLDGLLDAGVGEFIEFSLKPVIHNLDELKRLADDLEDTDRELKIHLKIDTGMGRLGFFPSETDELFAILKGNKGIHVEGVMTHLACADEEDAGPTDRQFLLFNKLKLIYAEKGLAVSFFHIANSAAIIDGRLDGFSCVRPGIMLYGARPNPRQREKIDLKPVLVMKTKIISLKHYPIGSAISYGGTYVTKRESLVAVLPVGYADGYPRLVSNRGFVLVRGMKAPVAGRVCMDLTLVDVTDVPHVCFGDDVVLIGSQGNEKISAEEVACWADTISYEILCGISSRVPRIYLGM